MVALSRGRLGKGGIPDQMAAARSILNDWNLGVIPYHTVPPKVHTSSIPSVPRIPDGTIVNTSDALSSAEDVTMGEADGSNSADNLMKGAADVGAAQYVSKFSAPFDLDGLFDASDKAVLEGGDDEEEGGTDMMETEEGYVPWFCLITDVC